MSDTTSKIRGKKTHNMTGTKIFFVWTNMLQRCYNPTHKYYKSYGGRGIKVCDEWVTDFAQFYKDVGDKPEGMSLDRIDNDGNYEPGNVKWSDIKEQSSNTRRNVWIEHDGLRMTIAQWARHLEVNPSTLNRRLKTMPVDLALRKGDLR